MNESVHISHDEMLFLQADDT